MGVKRIAKKLLGSKPDTKDKTYRIEGELTSIDITLPYNHKLPEYQRQFRMYDRKIARIAKIVYDKKKGACIDIGANIGDTALIIRTSSKIPVICIEGDAGYFSYLEKNTKNQRDITLVKCFVGKETETVKGSLVKVNGTGKIVGSEQQIDVLSLSDILAREKIDPAGITLLKSDTYGFDYDILMGSSKFISANKPALFFEYEINTAESHKKSLELIGFLSKEGYSFIAYDNFGNYMWRAGSDAAGRFHDLNTYITSCLRNGGGIYYADIFASTDPALIEELCKQESVAS